MALNILLSLLGGLSTYYLSEKLKWTAVKSSAMSTLVFCITIYIIHQIYPLDYSKLLAVFYGSTFVGMASGKVFTIGKVIPAIIFYALLYSIIGKYFNNVGGTLGTAACLSCVLVYLTHLLFKKNKPI